MALKIYESPDPSTSYSIDGAFTNPINFTVDGTIATTLSRRLFVRNDDATKYYISIQIEPIVSTGLDIALGTVEGFGWKLKEGDTTPLEAEWDLITPGNSISLSDLGSSGTPDTTTYLPFWIRIYLPSHIDVQSFEGLSLEITATESAV